MSSHDSGSGRRDSEAGPIIDVKDVTKSFDTVKDQGLSPDPGSR
jgi:hypothetical protein